MSILKIIAAVPNFLTLAAQDSLSTKQPVLSPENHLSAAVEWLVKAHDYADRGGVSYGYSLKGGWRPPYVETTGYIATTFFNLAEQENGSDFKARAIEMCDWLCEAQLADGSFTNDRFANNSGIVFDTGQDLFGLVRAFKETGNDKFANAANRAADWLVNIADTEGKWTRSTHMGIPHVYNSRVAWALLQANKLWPSDTREKVARANLDYAVSQENNGWFSECAFTSDADPFTHTIAYAIRGLWESGEILDDDGYRTTAVKAANAVATQVRRDGFLAGQFTPEGKPAANYVCLTGNCQMAIIWAKLFNKYGDKELLNAATRALRFVMSTQFVNSGSADYRGAIKGSYPVWGRYSPLTYPNWATKFFVDALCLLKESMD